MNWWAWMLLSVFLCGAELAVPGGLFMLFFGAGAIIVGLLVVIVPAMVGWVQWLLFAVISIGLLISFRQKFRDALLSGKHGRSDALVNEIAIATTAMPAGEVGRAELRGTAWAAKNVGSAAIESGARCKVIRSEGLTLLVQSE